MKIIFPKQLMNDFKEDWNSKLSDEKVKYIAKQLSKHC